jgi:hypothetical protein
MPSQSKNKFYVYFGSFVKTNVQLSSAIRGKGNAHQRERQKEIEERVE